MATLINGKAMALQIQENLKQEIKTKKLNPSLAVVLVGEDPASKLYVNLKKKACAEVGISFHDYLLAVDTKTEKVLEVINFLNKDKDVNAILVQLPLPEHLDKEKIIAAVDPAKDVDGFHPTNLKKLLNDQADFIPGLSLGIMKLITSTAENLEGKQALIISKSEIFYKPLAKILNDQKVCTAIVGPKDKNLKNKCLAADILVVAGGQPAFITGDMVKDDSIIIDVGTNKLANGKLVGDVDYESVAPKVKFITPVPGGVGPMTVAMLLYNTVQLSQNKKSSAA